MGKDPDHTMVKQKEPHSGEVHTEQATNLINALIKAKKNLRMYPENHPVYEKTVDDLCLRMSSILEEDTIKIRINQYDILYEGEVIYHSKDRDESLALLFFKDGLREITFFREITRNEIRDFLTIISLDFEKEVLDDDIVTLLWEKDFEHIKYIVDDSLILEDRGYEDTAVKQARGAAGKNEKIIKAYEEALSQEKQAKVNIIPLTDDDIQSVVEEIEMDARDKTHILIRMLFEMFHMAQIKDEFQVIGRCIRETLTFALQNARIEIIAYALKEIERSAVASAYPGEAKPYLANIENYIHTANFITLFGKALDNGAEIPEELLIKMSSSLKAVSIPHFISLLGELEQSSSRRNVIDMLSVVGKKDIALVSKGLNDKRWYVVRNIVYVLRKIRDRSAVDYIVRTAGHADKRVRKEAVHALGELGTDAVIPVLKERVSDEEESVRIAACMALGSIKTAASKNIILEHIGSSSFRDRSFAEKNEICKVLSRWNESDVIEFLVKTIKKRAFLRRAKNNETRAAAIHCLGMIGPGTARPVIERFRKSKNKILQNEAVKALRKH